MYPFKEGCFAPRNAWYVAGFPHELSRELLTRWVLNEPVVFYRTEEGTAVAVAGRCPHRNFPLGESKLIGDSIQCGYHGITFDTDGRCTRIPSQDIIPASYRLRSYPVVESGLWVWIWPGDVALADTALIPTPEEVGLSAEGFVSRPMYSMHIEGRYQLMNDNLLDLSHVGFLHTSSVGTEENATTPEVRDVNERRLSSRRYMMASAAPEILKHRSNYLGLIDRMLGLEFFPPGLHAHHDITRVFDQHPERPGEILSESRHWHAITPSTYSTTLYFMASAQRTEQQLDFLYEYLKPVIDEDIFATQQIERMIGAGGEMPPELMIRSDATAVQGRRILQTMMDIEVDPAAPQRAEPVSFTA